MFRILAFSFLVSLFLLVSCGQPLPTRVPPTPTIEAGVLAARATPSSASALIPAVATRQFQVADALKNGAVLPLLGLDGERADAQIIALRDPRFTENARTGDGKPLRAEIFGVVPLRASDFVGQAAICRTTKCYRVEMYNYALNLLTSAIVELNTQRVLAINQYENTQPDPPQALVDLAIDIAKNSPQVQQALGYTPDNAQAMMANTKTSLKASACERSLHYCLAPTFKVGDRALWAIVDLTDNVLVGTRWTNLGSLNGAPLTERTLQNDVVAANFCEKENALANGDWKMNFILTSSDGLRVSEVEYKGNKILTSAKVVDWHVSYSTAEAFGYSDATGCPIFSQAAVVAFTGPQVLDLMQDGKRIGFELVQDFFSEFWPLPCNYYYQQRFQFHDDGSFRLIAANLGRGCGTEGTYRPVTRIEWAQPYSFAEWSNGAWKNWETEQWKLAADVPENDAGVSFRIVNAQGAGYDMQTGRAQFSKYERGDNAMVFVTRNDPQRDEGASDLPTIGPCCNTDFRQGPEKFLNDEAIANTNLVLWYVAQLKNDNTPNKEYCWADVVLENGIYNPRAYPCYSGPYFNPIAQSR